MASAPERTNSILFFQILLVIGIPNFSADSVTQVVIQYIQLYAAIPVALWLDYMKLAPSPLIKWQVIPRYASVVIHVHASVLRGIFVLTSE